MSMAATPDQSIRPDAGEPEPGDIEAAMSRALAPVVAQAGSPPDAEPDQQEPAAAAEPTSEGVPAAPSDDETAPGGQSASSDVAATEDQTAAPAAATRDERAESSGAGAGDDKPDAADWPEPATPPMPAAVEPADPVEADEAPEEASTATGDDRPTTEEANETTDEEPAAAEGDRSSAGEAEPLPAPSERDEAPGSPPEQMPAPESQQGAVGETAEQAAEIGEPEPAFEAEASPEVLPDSGPATEQPAMPTSPMVAAGLAMLSGETDEPMTDRESGREPAGADHHMTHARNRVYDHLVEGEDDVIGLITYSLYKQDKRDWLVNWMAHHGTEPTADQVEAFVNAQMTTAQRERYRNAARQVLDAYASVAVDLEKPVIVRDAIAGRVEDAARKAERSTGFWRQFGVALLGGVITAAIVIGVVAILIAAGVDLAGYLGFEANAG